MYESRGPSWHMAVVTPARRRDVVEEALDGDALLVDPGSGSAHRLNETAACVWRLCDGRTTTQRIAQRLTEEYEVSFDDALDCVDQIVLHFADSNLLATREDG